MSTKNNGGPAFPRSYTVADANDNAFKQGWEGMTLRDWFAGQALVGIPNIGRIQISADYRAAAEIAYCLADAMLAERSKEAAPEQGGLTITIRTEVPNESVTSIFINESGETMRFLSIGLPETDVIKKMIVEARAKFAERSKEATQ